MAKLGMIGEVNRRFLRGVSALVLAACGIVPEYAFAQTRSDTVLPGHTWTAELSGPTKRCKVPVRFAFVVADAIIKGKVVFQNQTYWPQGRMEDSFETELDLIRFYADPKPLVSIKANEKGVGSWSNSAQNCTGTVRIIARSDRD